MRCVVNPCCTLVIVVVDHISCGVPNQCIAPFHRRCHHFFNTLSKPQCLLPCRTQWIYHRERLMTTRSSVYIMRPKSQNGAFVGDLR